MPGDAPNCARQTESLNTTVSRAGGPAIGVGEAAPQTRRDAEHAEISARGLPDKQLRRGRHMG